MKIKNEKNRKVCLLRISTRIFPDKGGPAKQVYLLSNYISKNNIRVVNLTCNPYKNNIISKEIINKNNYNYYLPFNAPKNDTGILNLLFFFIRFMIIGLFKAIYIKLKFKIL